MHLFNSSQPAFQVGPVTLSRTKFEQYAVCYHPEVVSVVHRVSTPFVSEYMLTRPLMALHKTG
jgi:hypothetical protein